MPCSPGTSTERVSPSVDAKIHAEGTAPAVSIAPDICFRKVRLEVIMRHHPREQLRACSEHVPKERQICFEMLHHRPGKGEKPKPGRWQPEGITSLRTCR